VVGGGREGQGEPDGESGRGTRSAAAGPAAEATIRSCCARKGSRELRARVIPFKLSSGLFVGPGVPAKSEKFQVPDRAQRVRTRALAESPLLLSRCAVEKKGLVASVIKKFALRSRSPRPPQACARLAYCTPSPHPCWPPPRPHGKRHTLPLPPITTPRSLPYSPDALT
jgi:hypothetical protein